MRNRKIVSVIGAFALLAITAGTALGHHFVDPEISGTVDCAGNYTITVTADFYGRVSMKVGLNGEAGAPVDGTILFDSTDDATSGTETYVFTGTGGADGMLIEASLSDGDYTSGFLVLNQESCATPTPTPTPTVTPTETPIPSIPDTSLSVLTTDSTGDLLMALFGAMACAGLIATIVGTAKRAEKR